MNDLEMVRLCAEAMGISDYTEQDDYLKLSRYESYSPLYNDAQAMALVKQFRLNIGHHSTGWCKVFTGDLKHEADSRELHRAIVECVAKIQQAKK